MTDFTLVILLICDDLWRLVHT